jgi:hypothetical protein
MGLFSSSASKDSVDPKEAAKHIFTLAKAHADGRKAEQAAKDAEDAAKDGGYWR